MLTKKYSKSGSSCWVTFNLPADVEATTATLCGEFNEWSPATHSMKKRKDGRFSTTVILPAGKSYRFKYLIDGTRWENDWDPDGYVANSFGTEDSIVEV